MIDNNSLAAAAANLPTDRRRRLAYSFAEQRDQLVADGDHGLAAVLHAVAVELVAATDRERDALRKLDFVPGVEVIQPGRLIE